MSTLWLIAWYEFRRHVFKRSFIISIVGMPLLLLLMFGPVALAEALKSVNEDTVSVGYVDHSGLLSNPLPPPENDQVEIVHFESDSEARGALSSGSIEAYYVLPQDYRETRSAQLIYNNEDDFTHTMANHFWTFVQHNLLADTSPEIAQRIIDGSTMIVRLEGDREFESDPTLSQILPLLTSVAFLFLIFNSSGYLMQALSDEKTNRTIEVLITSISPSRFAIGKILGIVGLSFTLMLVWVFFAWMGIRVAGDALGIAWFLDAEFDVETAVMMVLVFIPAYVFVASVMVAVGATLVNPEEGQITAFVVIVIALIPLMIPAVLQDPDGLLPVILTLCPLLSLPTIALRSLFMPIPTGQLVASIIVQSAFALGGLWLAGKAIRIGLLRYGQAIHWRELLGRPTAPDTTHSLSTGGDHA